MPSLGRLSVILSLLLTLHAAAQPPTQPPKARTLFDHQADLGLSNAQIASMKKLVEKLRRDGAAGQKRLQQQEVEYTALVRSPQPDPAQVKQKLQLIARTSVDLRFHDFEVSRQLLDVMTPAQKKKWAQIRADNKARASAGR